MSKKSYLQSLHNSMEDKNENIVEKKENEIESILNATKDENKGIKKENPIPIIKEEVIVEKPLIDETAKIDENLPLSIRKMLKVADEIEFDINSLKSFKLTNKANHAVKKMSVVLDTTGYKLVSALILDFYYKNEELFKKDIL